MPAVTPVSLSRLTRLTLIATLLVGVGGGVALAIHLMPPAYVMPITVNDGSSTFHDYGDLIPDATCGAANTIAMLPGGGSGSPISLPDAICAANRSLWPDTIILDTDVTLDTVLDKTDGANGTFSVRSDITLDGRGNTIQRDPTFTCPDDSNPEFRLFHVAATGDLTLNDVTVSNGCARGGLLTDGGGGGISNQGGTLTIDGSTIYRNEATRLGGGIVNWEGTVTVDASTISENEAPDGGGIVNWGGTLTVDGSTISKNEAVSVGGGIFSIGGLVTVQGNSTLSKNEAEFGGGIHNWSGTVIIDGSTLFENEARSGGGIYNEKGGTVTVDGSTITISRNSAADGGDIANEKGGTVTVDGSTFPNNKLGCLRCP